MANKLLTDIHVATMAQNDLPYGLVKNATIAMQDNEIAWVGASDGLPDKYQTWAKTSLNGRLVTPALIDCHTHIVFGGNRANEFEMRLNGASYEEVARAGGGIVSTVKATRNSTLEELVQGALPRVDAMLKEGITTIEVKSGYGLDVETELNMLRAARMLESHRDVRIITSFLGAHAIPDEYKDNSDTYIRDICIPTLKAAHNEGLVDAVDGFCEGIAFTPDQIAKVFGVAKDLGLPVKLHAEQLSNLGGAKLAAQHGALSVDHIEYLDEDGVEAIAKSGTIAVILPGAFYTLRETQKPPIKLLRKYKVPMAIATDCNPGSSPMTSLLLAMNMGCTLFKMTPLEAMQGVTVNAAKALGLNDLGTIETGKTAELAVWDIEHPAELSYRIGFNPLHRIIRGE